MLIGMIWFENTPWNILVVVHYSYTITPSYPPIPLILPNFHI